MIEINNISKVFRTSEVETVALNHEIGRASCRERV